MPQDLVLQAFWVIPVCWLFRRWWRWWVLGPAVEARAGAYFSGRGPQGCMKGLDGKSGTRRLDRQWQVVWLESVDGGKLGFWGLGKGGIYASHRG